MLNCLKPSGMLKSGLSSNLTLHSPDFLEIDLGKALAANLMALLLLFMTMVNRFESFFHPALKDLAS